MTQRSPTRRCGTPWRFPTDFVVDVGTKALGREGNTDKEYGVTPGGKAALAKLKEHHGFHGVPHRSAP